MFMRPVKGTRGEGGAHRRFEAVWVDAEELVGEGMLVSPRMMADHMPDRLCKARAAEHRRAPTGCTTAVLLPRQGQVSAPCCHGMHARKLLGNGRLLKAGVNACLCLRAWSNECTMLRPMLQRLNCVCLNNLTHC